LDNDKKNHLDLNKKLQWTKYIFSAVDFTFRQEKNWVWN